MNSPTTSANPGRLVVAVGIPGSGKSAVFGCLGGLSGLRVIREPDERDWHESVTAHGYSDRFSALTWFRSLRVPQLRHAAELRRRGETVLVDNYYDKLVCDILGEPGLDRLIPPTDAYYGVFGKLARIDRTTLPDADCLVFFEVEKEDWRTMLRTRRNEFDRAPGSKRSTPSSPASWMSRIGTAGNKRSRLSAFLMRDPASRRRRTLSTEC